MTKIMITLLLTLTTLNVWALDFHGYKGCGTYKLGAVIRKVETGFVIVVNEKTKSEYVLKIPTTEQLKILAYIDRPSLIEVALDTKLDGTKGEVSTIIKTERRIPDPLHPTKDTGFIFLKGNACKK